MLQQQKEVSPKKEEFLKQIEEETKIGKSELERNSKQENDKQKEDKKDIKEDKKESFFEKLNPFHKKEDKEKPEEKKKEPKKEKEDFTSKIKNIFKKEKKEEEPHKIIFNIEPTNKIPKIPEFKNKEDTDVKYPLIPPYSYAHIEWDEDKQEVIYELIEPELSKKEKEILKILEEGIKELINISFISIKKGEEVIKYLEKNIRVLLKELGLSLSDETFKKIMYYIYRDFVGLNEMEPLLSDYFIEDIECNGVNTPVYIVHRKYRNLKTNIVFKSVPYLASFVEKLAQKAGKYVSYANPVLDGSLPDGSRVNATYTTDISSKGPTITIRKFTKEPWSPTKLIQLGTISPEILAYLWILIEHEFNVMIIGGTGSGKTTMLNGVAFFIPPQSRIVSIEDSVLGDTNILIKRDKKISLIKIKNFIDDGKSEILTLDNNYKIRFVKPTSFIKHKTNKDIYEILTSTGRKIKVTKDHSIFTLGDSGLKEVKPTDLIANKSFIAVPRKLPFNCDNIKNINLLEYLGKFPKDFIYGPPIQGILKKYDYKYFDVSKSTYQWWRKHNIFPVREFIKLDYKFSDEELPELYLKTKNKTKLPVIFNISDEILQFFGLWLGDGSYDNFNKNRVIISNNDKECINLVKKIALDLNLNISKMNDNCSLTINSTLFYNLMKYVFKFDGYSKTKRIPEFVFNLSNEQLKHFIKGYFSADGTVKKHEVCCCSQSRNLLEEMQTLFLRLNMITRINPIKKDGCMELSISSYENVSGFKKIRFLQERKNVKLNNICISKARHTFSDIIPLSLNDLREINKFKKIDWKYFNKSNIGRDYLNSFFNLMSDKKGQLLPQNIHFIEKITNSDLFWDKIVSIKKLPKKQRYVYDFNVEGFEKFIGQNIILHNTRELSLEHDNWLPSVAREGIGLANLVGQKYGEVTLFDLLKESFRQRPDYVIVGEVRGKEAYVLFQGMASGHPSMGTMHANDVDTMIRRLETPPINLSPSLVESMDVVCAMSQSRIKGKAIRRLKKVYEIISVPENGKAQTNSPFLWDPKTDSFFFNMQNSHLFNKLIERYGFTQEQLMEEFDNRTRLLYELYRKEIFDYRKVQEVIKEYARSPRKVLKQYGIIR